MTLVLLLYLARKIAMRYGIAVPLAKALFQKGFHTLMEFAPTSAKPATNNH